MLQPANVLVTGANGFVGRAVCRHLAQAGWTVRGSVRLLDARFPQMAEPIVVGDLSGETNWSTALRGVTAVIHLAARVHVMRETNPHPISEFRDTNVHGTMNLAQQALQAGVKRFVFVSTAKVMGEGRATPYTEGDVLAPQDAYAVSKCEAEEGLRRFIGRMELVVIRPPLVYGPGVGANFRRLVDLIDKGLPLPFSSIENRRSLIYVENLADGIRRCIEHPAAAGGSFLISDNEDVSTRELAIRLAKALGRTPRLFPMPPFLMRWAASVFGRNEEVSRLLGSMQVESSLIRERLDWRPPFKLDDGLQETVRWKRQQCTS